MMGKFILLFLVSALFLSCKTADNVILSERNPQWAQQVEGAPFKNLYKIDEGVYRSEQPSKEQFLFLESYGIKEVLNLRNYHNDNSEGKDTDITLLHVKMAAHNIRTKDVVKALQLIKSRQGAILIHCKHGADRTSLVAAMYRITYQGWTKEEAIAELKEGGYGFHGIYKNIIRFINNADIEAIKKEVELQNEN